MKARIKSTLTYIGLTALLVTFCLGGLAWRPVGAANRPAGQGGGKKDKVSSDLRERLSKGRDGGQTVEVVLQLKGKPTGQLNTLLRREGVRLKDSFDGFASMAVSLPAGVVEELASF